jgi:DNA-binding MarR family transcriptional regulator
MAQRAVPGTEDDSGAEAGQVPVLLDEVDDLVAAWRAQRPDLDVEPMQVLSRISRLARHLDIARRGAFADHGLETWEFDVLSALRRQGPPFQLTPGALLRATLVTSGTMTNRIDRLAAAGLVRREPDPRDKRGVLVTLTEQGVARADAALADLLRRERALLSVLDRSERQRLADLMRTLLVPFDALLSRSPPAYSNSAAMVSQRSSRSDFSVWTARSSAPREVSFS